jgi:hypothetical protein
MIGYPTMLQMLLGLYGYLLPLLLYILWSTLALWDIGRRADLRSRAVWLWALAIFLLPFIGPLAYLTFAAQQLPRRSRIVTICGGAGAYALVLLIAAAIGGAS